MYKKNIKNKTDINLIIVGNYIIESLIDELKYANSPKEINQIARIALKIQRKIKDKK